MNFDGFKYFTMQELCKSNTANRLGIDNWPREQYIFDNLKNLVWDILDPAREKLGAPIYINSGFRSKETNVAVNGAKNSAHLIGCACDCRADNMKALLEILKTMNYDQLIVYYVKGKMSWFHVSYVTDRQNRHQFITIRK